MSKISKKVKEQADKDGEQKKVTTIRFKDSEYQAFLAECKKDELSGSQVLSAFIKVYKSGDVNV